MPFLIAASIAVISFILGFLAGIVFYMTIIRSACDSGKAFLKNTDGRWYPFNPYRAIEKEMNHD